MRIHLVEIHDQVSQNKEPHYSIHICIDSHHHMPKAQKILFFTPSEEIKKNTYKFKKYNQDDNEGLVPANTFTKQKNKMVNLQRNKFKLQALIKILKKSKQK